MKSRTTLILFAAILMAFTSCDKIIMPSGNVTQENYSITGYTAIDISDAFDVTVTFTSPTEGIIIEADDNVHEYIDIKKIGNRLYIGVERNFNLNGRGTLKAYISTNPSINEFYTSGASTLKFADLLEGSSVTMDVSGASRILGEVDIDKITAKASGASNINLIGSTDNLIARASGASQIGGYELLTQDVDLNFSGASTGFFNFDGTMNVVASGASTIYYKGEGTIEAQEITGASNIINAN